MSRLGPVSRWTPRITHEVLDQVCLFNCSLEIRAATNRCPPTFLQPKRIPVVKHKRNQNQRKPPKQGDPVLANGRAVCGIDIGKRRHAAAALSPQGEILARIDAFSNTQAGIDRLEQEVLLKAGGPGKVLVAMEATGHYWMCLYVNLRRRGYDGVVLNPLQTSARGNVRIRKTQTDRIDAVGIARLILCGDAKATRVPDPAIIELRLLVRHRRRLLRAIGGIERYAHTLIDRVFPEYADVFCNPFLPSSEKLIRQVGLSPRKLVEKESEVREILRIASRGRLTTDTIDQLFQAAGQSIGTGQAEEVIDRQLSSFFDFRAVLRGQIEEIEAELEKRMASLDSPLLSLGISSVLAATIHAESDPIKDFDAADRYVAYAGLDPSLHESGDTIRRRGKISKRGSPLLRHALYLAAFVVYRKHDYFRSIYRRHRKRGKGHRNALVIVARHLALVIWRLLTDRRPFTKRPPQKTSFPLARGIQSISKSKA